MTSWRDYTDEEDETLTIALGPDDKSANGFDHSSRQTNVALGAGPDPANNSFSVKIIDSNISPARPQITLSAGADIEEGEDAVFTFTAKPAPTADVTLDFDISEPIANAGDFVDTAEEGSKTVVLKKGTTTVTYTVSTVDNNTDDNQGFIRATMNALATGYTYTNQRVNLTVNDNDAPLSPSVVITESGSGTTVAEYTDGTQLTDSYEVKLATQPSHDVTVTATLPLGSGARVRKSGGSVGRTVTLSFSPSGSTNLPAIRSSGVELLS